jgi:hypothetical protein
LEIVYPFNYLQGFENTNMGVDEMQGIGNRRPDLWSVVIFIVCALGRELSATAIQLHPSASRTIKNGYAGS